MIIQGDSRHIPRDSKGRFIKGFQSNPSTQFRKGEHWRQPGPHWKKEWLYQKYIVEKLSSSEISTILNCHRNNVIFWLDKHGIPKRNTSESRAVKRWGATGKANPMYGKRGILHPNWQGGLTPFRQSLYSKTEAKEWFRKVYSRDGKLCRVCLSDLKTQVHHILPIRLYPLLALDPNNGIVLCQTCHKKIKRNEKRYAKKLFTLIQEAKSRAT